MTSPPRSVGDAVVVSITFEYGRREQFVSRIVGWRERGDDEIFEGLVTTIRALHADQNRSFPGDRESMEASALETSCSSASIGSAVLALELSANAGWCHVLQPATVAPARAASLSPGGSRAFPPLASTAAGASIAAAVASATVASCVAPPSGAAEAPLTRREWSGMSTSDTLSHTVSFSTTVSAPPENFTRWIALCRAEAAASLSRSNSVSPNTATLPSPRASAIGPVEPVSWRVSVSLEFAPFGEIAMRDGGSPLFSAPFRPLGESSAGSSFYMGFMGSRVQSMRGQSQFPSQAAMFRAPNAQTRGTGTDMPAGGGGVAPIPMPELGTMSASLSTTPPPNELRLDNNSNPPSPGKGLLARRHRLMAGSDRDDPNARSNGTHVPDMDLSLRGGENGGGDAAPTSLLASPGEDGSLGGMPLVAALSTEFATQPSTPRGGEAVHERESSGNLFHTASSLQRAAAQPPSTAPFAWRKGQRLGDGASGAVYACFNLNNGTMLAVKEVELPRQDAAKCLAAVQNLRREVNALVEHRHPNIVRFFGCECTHEGIARIFMEYVPGGSLADVVATFGPLPVPVAARYICQLLGALSVLHERRIVHRDVKGANLLLDSSGNVKLADFGCAKEVVSLSPGSASVLKGTVLFLAPEILSSTENYAPSSDLWGVGCVLIELLTAKPPWPHLAAKNPVTAMYAIATAKSAPPLPPESDLPPALNRFFARVFSMNPAARGTAAELLRMLQPLMM